MNFEKLIEEQKKTQELLKRIDQTRTLSQFFEEVEPVALPFAEDVLDMADQVTENNTNVKGGEE